MTYRKSDRILKRLLKLHPKIIDLSLDRMTGFLSALGNPQEKLPPVIHVAGTNGKGSTIAFILSILDSANLSIHVYTSPHLVYFNERIRLNGALISEKALSELLDHCETVNGANPITYFEITTAAAIKAFADNPADVLILEVGLGGRLDATNIVDRPLSTVITPISQDHEQYLGSDLSTIAMEKASIAKKDVPLITGPQMKIVQEKIEEISALKKAKLISGWTVEPHDNGFIYHDEFGSLTLPLPNLVGPHQISNAALAIATLRHQDKIIIDEKCYGDGITSANWAARMQNITDSPFGRMLAHGSELWLDGGHNPAAGEVIANSFMDKGYKNDELILICGMMENKDTAGYLKPFNRLIKKLYAVHVEGELSHTPEAIIHMARANDIEAVAAENVMLALQMIGNDKPKKILICGSLYLAGQVLFENDLIPR